MWLAALFGGLVGLSLGLTGGGGSILAVPLLVYGLGFEFRQAVALSLGIVGATALYGAVLQRGRGQVAWTKGIALGIGGVAGAPIGAALGKHLSDRTSLVLFAVMMVHVGTRMPFSKTGPQAPSWLRCQETTRGHSYALQCATKLVAGGFITGVLSGMFGVGGGFPLIPTLLAIARLTMEQAMATSLVAIVIFSCMERSPTQRQLLLSAP